MTGNTAVFRTEPDNGFYILWQVQYNWEKIPSDQEMDPHSRGRPRAGSHGTRSTCRTSHQCFKHFPTVKCIQLDHCKCWLPGRRCKGIHTFTKFYNKVLWTTLPRGRPMAGTAPRITENVIEKPQEANRSPPNTWRGKGEGYIFLV